MILRVVIKYSHSHLSSHPSSHLKMPTKIEIDKILTPSNFDFHKKLTPGLYFNCTILTPDIMNKALYIITVENYLTFAGQNHAQYSLHSSIVKDTL